MLVASILMMCAAVVGTRVVFVDALDLRANWIFRVMPISEADRICMAGAPLSVHARCDSRLGRLPPRCLSLALAVAAGGGASGACSGCWAD